MAQLPDVLSALTPEAQQVYDRILTRRRAIRGRAGPWAALIHHPPAAEAVASLSEYLRFTGTLPGDVREMAILITSRAMSQPFEWVAHAPVARQAGLSEEIIERIRTRGDLAALPPRYARPARVVQHVLARESLPQALQDAVQAEFGVSGLLELVLLPGFYQLIGGILFAFDEPLPPGERAPF